MNKIVSFQIHLLFHSILVIIKITMTEKIELGDPKETQEPLQNPDAAKELSQTNFDFLYDSFHQPLTDIISSKGSMIGIDKKGEIKHFQHTADTESVESQLCKYAKSRNIELLALRLTKCNNNNPGRINDSLKYILFFYKVVYLFL